jgi:hypothetical protein
MLYNQQMLISFALQRTTHIVWWIIVQVNNKARQELTTVLDFNVMKTGGVSEPGVHAFTRNLETRPNSRGQNGGKKHVS